MDLNNLTERQDLLEIRSSQHQPKSSNLSLDVSKQPFVRRCGLTTKEALTRLHDDMSQEVDRMKQEFSRRKFLSWLRESISFKSELSKMRWPSVVFMTAQAIAHFIVAFILNVNNPATDWVDFQGFLLALLLIFNLAVNLWDTKLRFKELLMKSEQILSLIKRCSKNKQLIRRWRQYSWTSAHAKLLFAPKSPCTHQTLTYRDESCLNLPDYLLVKGDIIHLYPGERAPGHCVKLDSGDKGDAIEDQANQKTFLEEGQVFQMQRKDCINDPIDWLSLDGSKIDKKDTLMMQFCHSRLKKANRGSDFLMLSTPYIKSLRISLQRSHKRPVNSVEKECFIISRKYFETFVIPSVFILSTIVTAIHYGYLDLTDSDQKIKTISIAYLLLRPSLTIMPFLPWMFPCFWLAVNAYGSARILCCAEAHRKKAINKLSTNLSALDTNGITVNPNENLLATPTAAGSSENKHDEDELHDLSSNIRFWDIFRLFIDLVKGDSGHVWRSSSLLQVLGCLTSLCCIDKVGILSWSNPTPEKVFVLTKCEDNGARHMSSRHDHLDEIDLHDQHVGDHSEMHIDSDIPNGDHKETDSKFGMEGPLLDNFSTPLIKHSNRSHQVKAEVLDLSQASSCMRGFDIGVLLAQQQGQLQFDDLNWRQYMSNLKPLGLAILMNNCCENSFGDYFRFYKHICYESILRCNLTPVVKRRCLCALSKLIGFNEDSIINYKYMNQIGMYKLIDPSSIKKSKLAEIPSLENTRLKMPFPNMICNIHQDVATGGFQVFSQGTADLVLDACAEFWDGKKLSPLEEGTRKKIKDFYHRTSLTSYCSAFSYTPLLNNHELGGRYIEMPVQNPKFNTPLRKLASKHQEEVLENQIIIPGQPSYHNDNLHSSLQNTISSPHNQCLDDAFAEPRKDSCIVKPITRRHLSVEEIYKLEINKATRPLNADRKPYKLNETLDELTDQVFVGMVAMQYQACPDFVALVEQLEHACIRFVHFSKENELRSRVFSEKMGLESGWNCHISLQSDQDLDKADLEATQKSSNIAQHQEDTSDLGLFTPSTRISSVLFGSTNRDKSFDRSRNDSTSCRQSISSDERTLSSWKSLPSIVMRLTAKLMNELHHVYTPDHDNARLSKQQNVLAESSGDNLATESDYGEEICQETDANYDDTSNKDRGFESLAFDMSNRAKLPKGIENIRPHLETVDNVPLQVSLFTDCTPDLTQEMIEIMQEYGEIVCVIGSSSSRLNTPLFLQANASIAIEPLFPQCCTRTDEKAKKFMKKKAEERKKHQRKSRSQKNEQKNDKVEHTTIQMNLRPNNPRDRLGIGPSIEPSKLIKVKPPQRVDTPSSSSSSSSSSRSSFSSSSSRCSTNPPDSDEDNAEIGFNEEMTANDDSENSEWLIEQLPEPNALASRLASLPCSYSYNRKDPVNLYALIMEARHFTFKMKNTFVCMICFALSISSAQFMASILFLPPMLSSGLTIWLTVVVVPLMSFSLMSTTIDSQVMKIAVGKNLQLKPENITFFVICYLIKFIPSIFVIVLSFGLIIAHSCKSTGFGSSSLGPCWMFTYVQHGNATSTDAGDEDLLWSTHLLTAQVCAAFLMVLYFVVISAGFVHRSHLLWQKSPTRNRLWVIISVALILGQLFYNHLVLQVNLSSSKISYEFLASLPLHIWIISFVSPIIVIGINLLVKRAEIKATIRQQRRARFDFNTKLGMNSPF